MNREFWAKSAISSKGSPANLNAMLTGGWSTPCRSMLDQRALFAGILTGGLRENIVDNKTNSASRRASRYLGEPNMRLTMWTRAAVAAAAVAGLMTFAPAAASAEPVKIRV